MGGRNASSGAGGGSSNRNQSQPLRPLLQRGEVDEYTKDYTPQQFLGDVKQNYDGTPLSLVQSVEKNAPETLDVGGYTFKSMGRPNVTTEKNKDIITLDYQSTEQVGGEFPVLQVGIRAWKTPTGRVKSEIIRDGFSHKTRFW